MCDGETVLELDGCEVRFGASVALPQVNLRVGRGEAVALMGPSGSGKTTLLRVARGELSPTRGRAMTVGRDLSGLDRRNRDAVRRTSISQVSQAPLLLNELSVLENVALPLLLDGVARAAAMAAAHDRLRDVGVEEFGDGGLATLSGGEQQRVAVARALVRTVDLILADEPTASLDGDNAVHVAELLVELSKRSHAGLLMATHDERVASRCDRIVRLD